MSTPFATTFHPLTAHFTVQGLPRHAILTLVKETLPSRLRIAPKHTEACHEAMMTNIGNKDRDLCIALIGFFVVALVTLAIVVWCWLF